MQRISLGKHDEAIEYFSRAMRAQRVRSRIFRMRTGIAMGHLYSGRFDDALASLEQASHEMLNILRVAAFTAAAHAVAGRIVDAREAMTHVRRLDPTLRIGNLHDWLLVRRSQDFAMVVDGLRKARLPEMGVA